VRYGVSSAFLFAALPFTIGCRPSVESQRPTIIFTHIPPAGGGPEMLDRIGGRIVNSKVTANVAIYALNEGTWWVQPLRNHAVTEVASDGSWENATHLGTEYAVLLIASGYQPAARLSALPSESGSILAVASTKASLAHPPEAKTLHFSGYDWKVRSFVNDRGGEVCDYEPSNAWVDERGYLHLLMGQVGDRWHCAGIRMTRSLGYGTYRFVVTDSAHLPPSAVLAMSTQDPDGSEMDIELSRWGKTRNRNGDYVVQPYYIPENTVHFEVPNGRMTHILRWEPGIAAFKSFAGSSSAPRANTMEHVFRSGVPVPSRETLHLDFYDFHHSQSGVQNPVEVVVEKFEYIP
jgi:hypothetical protein